MPFVDETTWARDTPTGRTFELFQLVERSRSSASSASRTRRVMESDIHAVSLSLLEAHDRTSGSSTPPRPGCAPRDAAGGQGGAGEAARASGSSSAAACSSAHFGKNPNDYVNIDGRLKQRRRRWQLKVQAMYQLPAGLPRLGELLAPQRRPPRAPHARAPGHHAHPRGHADPAPAAGRERPPARTSRSSTCGCRRTSSSARTSRLSVFADALQPAQRGRDRGRAELARRRRESFNCTRSTPVTPRARSCWGRS